MIARFRDFICKIQAKIQKPPLVYTNPSFFICPPFLKKRISPPPPPPQKKFFQQPFPPKKETFPNQPC